MADKEALLRKAAERGVREQLAVLIEGTEQLMTGWTWRVGKNADYITYSEGCSKRRMVTYGERGEGRPLDADINQSNNQFGTSFRVTEDEVIARLKKYLPHACDAYETGYENRKADYVAIRDEADAERFLDFLRSFLEQDSA